MRYAILNRSSRLRRIARLSVLVSALTMAAGCGYSYSYEQALAENTPRAFMKFVEYNRRSKHCEAARQHLQELFQQGNIRSITVCYLSFDDEDDTMGGRWRAGDWGGSGMFREAEVSYEGASLWPGMKALVERELKDKGYRVRFDVPIDSTFKARDSWKQLHSTTAQGPSGPVESTVDLEPGAISNGSVRNRLTPNYYLAAEPFLKIRSWPDTDAVLLVTIPVVHNAADYADYTPVYLGGSGVRDMGDVSSLTIVYQLFDVVSKRQIFGDYLISAERTTAEDKAKSGRGGRIYWYFTESEESFYSRAVITLFKRLPARPDRN